MPYKKAGGPPHFTLYLVSDTLEKTLEKNEGKQSKEMIHLSIPVNYDMATKQYTLLPPLPKLFMRLHTIPRLLTNLEIMEPREFDLNQLHMDLPNKVISFNTIGLREHGITKSKQSS